jgi:endoglucanase
MQRREFAQATALLAAMAAVRMGSAAAGRASGRAPGLGGAAMGTNLSGMEWARPGLRFGQSTVPNMHFTVPRPSDVAYLAACGFMKNRLPIQWELLQPMLHDTSADAQARAAIGAPGAFHAGYESFITAVLDAHAAVGAKCLIDNHNYGRYQDFRYQPDGSVVGLKVPPDPLVRPYTSDRTQVYTRIFSLASGATLRLSHFVDFWTRAAKRWKDHPGFGGYGLMNEPHDMPSRGGTVPWKEEKEKGGEDLTIWPTFAQAAIHAIRAIDAVNPIYVAGNQYSSAMAIGTKNPGFPLQGDKLIYEVHMYLDAFSNGAAFDYDTEVAKNYSAGFGVGAIHPATGVDRIKVALDWARANGVQLALTEIGMPIDDTRWHEMFVRTATHAWQAGCEIYTWMGGNHWPIRNYAINHVPGWHQNKTLEPLVSGVLKACAGMDQASLFADGPGSGKPGAPVKVTVYARGNLAAPLALTVASSGGGRLSKSQLTIPAGANGQDSFSYTPEAGRVAVLSYRSPGRSQVPPPHRIFSLDNPVAHAAVSLEDAALAILARYGASKWVLSDGYTDYLLGSPARPGQGVRAISDSGFGSTAGNAMEMLNWINTAGGAMGKMKLPVMRLVDGRPCSDHSAPQTWGFWCKKSARRSGVQPAPANRVLYNLEDPHFVIAVISVPAGRQDGVVFQTSQAEKSHASELHLARGVPGARWVDAGGETVQLAGKSKLAPDTPVVMAMTSTVGSQSLRINAVEVARASATLNPSEFNQMLIGWGYLNYHPREGFGGQVYAVVAGKGALTSDELRVVERYLGALAGMTPSQFQQA